LFFLDGGKSRQSYWLKKKGKEREGEGGRASAHERNGAKKVE
jgi:hypothetical protein